MLPAQMPRTTPDEFSRCEERSHLVTHGKNLTSSQKIDAGIKGNIDRALWNDDVLRAIELYEIEVHVRDKVAYLNGHIASTTSQNRIQNAIRGVSGLLGIHNNLIMDDKLTREVAASLGTLEHTYGCKFFTGASHGVISLNGIVRDENVKLLAEKSISTHPNVRAVINNVRVSGQEQELEPQPFLQPRLGEIIYFLDGISGFVRHVIINPDNRRVIAMVLQGHFANQLEELESTDGGRAGPKEHLVVIPMDLVRYMTKASGFLHITSKESQRYTSFDASRFSPPKDDWKAPYPYCFEDVYFPVGKRKVEYQILEELPQSPFVVSWVEPTLSKELLANDSPGG